MPKISERNTTNALLRRVRNTPDANELDTEDGFSVGDAVEFDYHGGVIRGYVVRFYRDSYLFYEDGICRPYADVVQDWNKRDLQGYGHAVVLDSLRHRSVTA